MAGLFKPLEDRLVLVLERGYGTLRTVPSGWLRRSADRLSLLDPNYPRARFDGAYELQYLALADHDGDKPANPYAPAWLLDATVAVRIGMLEGAGAVAGFNPSAAGTGETALFATQNARRRALERAQRVWRALNWKENIQESGSDPFTVDVKPAGAVTLDDLGDGRVLATLPLLVQLQVNPASDYEPSE